MASNRKIFTPRPYQNLIIDHALRVPRSHAWAGMCMGKTVDTLSSLEALYCSGEETQPTLVLALRRVAASSGGRQLTLTPPHLYCIHIQYLLWCKHDNKKRSRLSSRLSRRNPSQLCRGWLGVLSASQGVWRRLLARAHLSRRVHSGV